MVSRHWWSIRRSTLTSRTRAAAPKKSCKEGRIHTQKKKSIKKSKGEGRMKKKKMYRRKSWHKRCSFPLAMRCHWWWRCPFWRPIVLLGPSSTQRTLAARREGRSLCRGHVTTDPIRWHYGVSPALPTFLTGLSFCFFFGLKIHYFFLLWTLFPSISVGLKKIELQRGDRITLGYKSFVFQFTYKKKKKKYKRGRFELLISIPFPWLQRGTSSNSR